jgi:hypothetical protein
LLNLLLTATLKILAFQFAIGNRDNDQCDGELQRTSFLKLRGKDLGLYFQEKIMKDILVVGMLKEGQFPRFMGFMQSEEGIAERKKIADLTQTIGTVAPDHSKVMFKIAVHDMDALHAFLNGSNPVSKPVFDEVMDGYEIYELNRV